jgi:ABC-type nitrate/sulfonate/bicarbonate transport system substrate-binding protein
MPKPSESRLLIERIAALEQFVSAIKEAQAAADYHRSEVVDLSIINAESAISEAVKSLAQYDRLQTNKSLNVAWFYAKFAQDILAAEATEHILGQDTFLDLVETQKHLHDWFQHTMERLEKRLLSYEGELLDANQDENRDENETEDEKEEAK